MKAAWSEHQLLLPKCRVTRADAGGGQQHISITIMRQRRGSGSSYGYGMYKVRVNVLLSQIWLKHRHTDMRRQIFCKQWPVHCFLWLSWLAAVLGSLLAQEECRTVVRMMDLKGSHLYPP